MKKNLILWLVITFICNSIFSQKLVKTYWDYKKTQLQTEYYTDAYGAKNGSFKGYSQYGGILIQANYKNDVKVGKYIENYENGKPHIVENYNDKGELDGQVSYYKLDITVPSQQGAYKSDKKNGIWTFIEAYTNYDLSDEEKKGCEFTKGSITYKEDKEVYDGKVILYFYPSGKIYWERNFTDGKKVGEEISYFPNGNKQTHKKFDADSKLIFEKSYYKDGKLQMSRSWETGTYVYEGYNQDGSPDSNMKYEKQQKEQEEAQSKKNAENYNNYIAEGDKKFASKDYEGAAKYFDAATRLNQGQAKEKYPKDKLSEIESILKGMQQKKVDAEKQSSDIDAKYQTYKGLYVETKPSAIFVDPQTKQPIMKTVYPKGEYLYTKSDALLTPLLTDYKIASDPGEKLEKGKYIVSILDKMIALAGTDTKEINKQVKKAESNDEVKKILGF